MTALIDRHSAGVYIIAATPFAQDGSLDLDSADRLVDFYKGCGVNGMTILGVMGEAPKLTPDESLTLARRMIARAAMPVIVGVSGGGLDPMRRLAHEVMAAGAAGVMVAPPAGMAPEDRVAGYYAAVCAALGPDIPVCLQDYPQLTGVRISADTVLSLTAEHPQIVMLKHEDWPGLNKLAAIRARSGEGTDTPRLSILCGNSALFLVEEMDRGADGAMTGYAYPEMLVQVCTGHADNPERAHDIFDAHLPMVRYEQQPGIGLAVRKEVLRRRGAIASAALRAPAPRLTPKDHDDVTRLMTRLERRLKEIG